MSDNIQNTETLLREWGAWGRDRNSTGYPKQSAFVSERVDCDNRSTDTYRDEVDPEIIRIDKEIERFAPRFRVVLKLEYQDKRSQAVKAAVLNMPRQMFNQRVLFMREQLSFWLFGD